jgi:large subunit ribosomal protein L19
MKKEVIEFNKKQRAGKMPDLRTGDVVRLHRKIIEGGKERTQVFEGMIIAVNGKQSSSPMITVRKVSASVGVELIVPVYSPKVSKIEVVKHAKIRRSKAYYVKTKSAKSLRMKYKEIEKFVAPEESEIVAEASEKEAS